MEVVLSSDARGRHIIDVSRTSGVSGTGTARGRCGNVSETFQRGWGRQRLVRECLYELLVEVTKANTPGIQKCYNLYTLSQTDIGLSPNTFDGAHSDAREVELTINGIGQRDGNPR
uniref:Uncharacterized protein n=1 Tax=Brassica oleracea var. oleracea TaxID=109376 RepID=A0A0D3A8T1_BRAOL